MQERRLQRERLTGNTEDRLRQRLHAAQRHLRRSLRPCCPARPSVDTKRCESSEPFSCGLTPSSLLKHRMPLSHDVRGRNHGCRARGEIAVSFAFQIIPTKTRFDGSSDKREPIEPTRYNGTVAAAGSHSASRPSDPEGATRRNRPGPQGFAVRAGAGAGCLRPDGPRSRCRSRAGARRHRAAAPCRTGIGQRALARMGTHDRARHARRANRPACP
jgi:hypothetical protein